MATSSSTIFLRPLLLLRSSSSIISSSSSTLSRCTQQHNNIINISLFHTTRNTQKSAASPFRDRLNELRRNGTPEIVFGGFVLAVVSIDYYLQRRNDQQKKQMIRKFEHEVKQDEALSRRDERELINKNGGVDIMKTQFQCFVRRVPQQFDGHKCLTNLKVGDVVNVLQEGVGPNNKYNLCSIERSPAAASTAAEEKCISVGWFPCSCLEKIQ